MDNNIDNPRELILKALSSKYSGQEVFCPRHYNEMSAKLKLGVRQIQEILDELIQENLVEKIIIPYYRGHGFDECATTNLNVKKTDFDGLQDPDDFEEIDPWDIELHEFYRRRE